MGCCMPRWRCFPCTPALPTGRLGAPCHPGRGGALAGREDVGRGTLGLGGADRGPPRPDRVRALPAGGGVARRGPATGNNRRRVRQIMTTAAPPRFRSGALRRSGGPISGAFGAEDGVGRQGPGADCDGGGVLRTAACSWTRSPARGDGTGPGEVAAVPPRGHAVAQPESHGGPSQRLDPAAMAGAAGPRPACWRGCTPC
jgi:hypothetical protein